LQEDVVLFIAIGELKPSSTTEARARLWRNWEAPPGVRIIGEYWTPTASTHVVVVLEAESVTALSQIVVTWEEHVHFTVTPALDAKVEGMELLRRRAVTTDARHSSAAG
jgi:hypothetical protein